MTDDAEAWQPRMRTASQMPTLIAAGCLVGGGAFVAARVAGVSNEWIVAVCLSVVAIGGLVALVFRSGVSPHTATIPIAQDLSDERAVRIAADALEGLGFRDVETGELTVTGCSPMSIATFGARVQVNIVPGADGSVFAVTAQPNDRVLIDYGASKKMLGITTGELSRRQALRP